MLNNGARVIFQREAYLKTSLGRGWAHAGFHVGVQDSKEGNVSLKVAVLSWLNWSSCAWWVSKSVSTLPRSVLPDHNSCGGSGGIRPRFQPSPRPGLQAAYWNLLTVQVQWCISYSYSKRWKDLGAGWFVLKKNGLKILLFLFTRSEQTHNCSNNQALNSLHWHLLSTIQHRPSEPVVLHASANWVCSSVEAARTQVLAVGEGRCLHHQPLTIVAASGASEEPLPMPWGQGSILSQGAWWDNTAPLGDLTLPVCNVKLWRMMGLLKFPSADSFLSETIYLQGSTSICFWNVSDCAKKEMMGKWQGKNRFKTKLPAASPASEHALHFTSHKQGDTQKL